MKKQALTTVSTALFLAVLTVGMASVATAQDSNDNETSDVNVTVTSTTALDVKPDQLTYEGVSVGARVTTTSNDHGYSTLKVENTGSNPIQRVWMSSELPTSNPFGSADDASSSNHVSTNFLQVKPSNRSDLTQLRGNDSVFHYVERTEFFQDNHPLVELGSSTGDIGQQYANVEVGRIRAGSNEFYFALGYDGDACDSGSEIRVADVATTPDRLGTTDFSNDGGDWTAYNMTTNVGTDSYGITNDTVELNLTSSAGTSLTEDETQSYDILSKCNGFNTAEGISEPHILLTRYDIESGDSTNLQTGDGNTAEELWRSSSDHLSPGQSFGVDVGVQVPRGVPNGDIAEGTLTVYSQAS